MHSKNRPSLPPLLDSNPDLQAAALQHARANIDVLTGEFLYHYIQETALPELLRRKQKIELDMGGTGQITMDRPP